MTTDIFIRSFDGDFEWLKYCLRSIQRFATGFRRTIVVVPNGQTPPTGTAEVVFSIHESGDGYMGQQVTKLHADCFSDAEFILAMDSDTIFTRPVNPDDFVVNRRKVRWLYTPYSSLSGDGSQTWKPITEKVMMRLVENEFMRRHPLVAPRWVLQGFREWMWKIHGMSIEAYVMSQPDRNFSEWNALGAYLWFYHHDKIEWQNTNDDIGIPCVHQSWSHGGLNDDLRNHLEKALA